MNTWDDNDPLTDFWVQQAVEAGKDLKKSWIHIDIIISSNLDRAINTAKIIGEHVDYSWEYIVDSRFREQDGGVFKWVSRLTLRPVFPLVSFIDCAALPISK